MIARPYIVAIGIDPGKTGAIGFIDAHGDAWGELCDTSDGHEVAALLNSHIREGCRVHVGIEKVGAMPGQGVTSMFKFGTAFGVPMGVCAAFQIPFTLVTPQRWTALAFRGHHKPKAKPERKKAILRLARQRWPQASLKRVKDGALAEALFMALEIQRTEFAEVGGSCR